VAIQLTELLVGGRSGRERNLGLVSRQTLRLRTGTAADLEIVLRHRQAMFREMGFADEECATEASREFFAAALRDDRYHA
jgi:hypothetical protein